MDHYDKRLLWASGGAFVVSFSAVQFLSRRPDGTFAAAAGSSVHLLLGWGLLVLSVIIEIGAPYATTRMAVYSKTTLTALHEGDKKRAVTEKKKSEAWGKLTKYLNEGAYFCLLLAFWYLGVYVYKNLPG